jgi:hypothetical protein
MNEKHYCIVIIHQNNLKEESVRLYIHYIRHFFCLTLRSLIKTRKIKTEQKNIIYAIMCIYPNKEPQGKWQSSVNNTNISYISQTLYIVAVLKSYQ